MLLFRHSGIGSRFGTDGSRVLRIGDHIVGVRVDYLLSQCAALGRILEGRLACGAADIRAIGSKDRRESTRSIDASDGNVAPLLPRQPRPGLDHPRGGSHGVALFGATLATLGVIAVSPARLLRGERAVDEGRGEFDG